MWWRAAAAAHCRCSIPALAAAAVGAPLMGSPSAAQRKTAVVTRNRLPLRGTADAQPMMPPPLQPPTTAPSRPWPPSAALPPPLEPPPAVAAPPLSYLAAGARAGARSTHGIDHRSNIMCNKEAQLARRGCGHRGNHRHNLERSSRKVLDAIGIAPHRLVCRDRIDLPRR